jgi:hypothetical protein
MALWCMFTSAGGGGAPCADADILARELRTAMGICGAASLADLDHGLVRTS